jgi:signal transduction histidine kinase
MFLPDFVNFLVLVSFICNSILLVLYLPRLLKSKANLTFGVVIITILAWHLSMLVYRSTTTPSSALAWSKILYFSASFIPSNFLLFTLLFPEGRLKPYQFALTAFANLQIIFITLLPGLLIQNVILPLNGEKIIIWGPLYPFYVLYQNIFFFSVLYTLYRKNKQLSGIPKQQIRLILFGSSFSIAAAFVSNLFLPTFGIFTLNWLGQVSTVIWVAFIVYAIVRHRFLNVTLAIRNALIYVFATLVVTLIALFFTLISNLRSPGEVDSNLITTLFLGSLTITLLLPYIVRLISHTLDKLLFGRTATYQSSLTTLAQKLPQVLDLDQLVNLIIDTLIQTMGLTRAAVLIADSDTGLRRYKISRTIGFDETNGISMVQDNFLTNYLEKNRRILVIDELQKIAEESSDPHESARLKNLIEQMIHIEAGLIIPVISNSKLKSLIVLGNKKGGDVYTSEDLDLLEIISSHAATAIENAQLYRQISEYNENLQEKIAAATRQLQLQNKKLQKANESLKSLDKMKDQLIAVTSHELRTPASIVKNYLWLLINQPEPKTKFTPKDLQHLERCYVGTQDLIQLINETLDASKLEGGKLEVSREPVNVKQTIEEACIDLRPKIKDKGLKLIIRPTNKQLAVLADPTRFREVLTNLIVNATKYTNTGSITISTKKDGKDLIFAIKDTGRGVAKENLPKLFTKFFREDSSLSSSNPQTGGTGLGLYLTKSLVELMKGKIWVESKAQKGSTFSFSLPLYLKK